MRESVRAREVGIYMFFLNVSLPLHEHLGGE